MIVTGKSNLQVPWYEYLSDDVKTEELENNEDDDYVFLLNNLTRATALSNSSYYSLIDCLKNEGNAGYSAFTLLKCILEIVKVDPNDFQSTLDKLFWDNLSKHGYLFLYYLCLVSNLLKENGNLMKDWTCVLKYKFDYVPGHLYYETVFNFLEVIQSYCTSKDELSTLVEYLINSLIEIAREPEDSKVLAAFENGWQQLLKLSILAEVNFEIGELYEELFEVTVISTSDKQIREISLDMNFAMFKALEKNFPKEAEALALLFIKMISTVMHYPKSAFMYFKFLARIILEFPKQVVEKMGMKYFEIFETILMSLPIKEKNSETIDIVTVGILSLALEFLKYGLKLDLAKR